ncbi:hypothetical protein A2U01_0058177, partial [Trifolium medium]|nr:hypothetical protein [Trifolium medium]
RGGEAWGRLWKIQAPPKTKHLLWRISEPQEDWHIFFDCEGSKDAWNIMGLGQVLQQFQNVNQSIKDVILSICCTESTMTAGRAAVLI